MINPIITKLFNIFIIAKSITISPADLKNIPDLELSFILNELKLVMASIGKVPSAKASIVIAPFQKLPVDRVYICID